MPDEVEHDTDWGPALSEQFAKADAEAPAPAPESAAPTEASEAASSTESTQEGRERDDSGRFVAKKPGAASNGTPPARASGSGAQAGAASGAPKAAAAPPGAAPVAPPAPVLDGLKPPQSLRPGEREEFAKAPKAIQEAIIRRERETEIALVRAKKEGELAESFRQTVAPYEAQFRQVGAQPMQYIGDLLKTAHALTYSSPQQKADIAAGIVMQFGVTPQDLDAALVARMNGQPAQQHQAPQPQFDKEALLQEVEQRIQAGVQQRIADAELVKIAPELEYIEDLKDDMAKVFDAGLASDYKEAYALALQLPKNADTLAIVRQKEAARSAANAQASTQRAKAAASSVSSKPGGGGNAPPGDDDDWDAHLNASWDRLASR